MKQEEYIKIQPDIVILQKLFPSFHPPIYELWKLKGNFDQIEKGKYDSVSSLLAEYGIKNEGDIITFCTLVLYMEARGQMISIAEAEGKIGILEMLDKFRIYLENNNIQELHFKGEGKNTGFATPYKLDNKEIINLFIKSLLSEFDRYNIQALVPGTGSMEDYIRSMGKQVFTFKGEHIIKGENKRSKGRPSSSFIGLQKELKLSLETFLFSHERLKDLAPAECSYFIGKLFVTAGLIASESDYESRASIGKESYSTFRDFLRRRIDSL